MASCMISCTEGAYNQIGPIKLGRDEERQLGKVGGRASASSSCSGGGADRCGKAQEASDFTRVRLGARHGKPEGSIWGERSRGSDTVQKRTVFDNYSDIPWLLLQWAGVEILAHHTAARRIGIRCW